MRCPKKTPRKSQFNHLILDRRLVLVLGQNSEVCARLVDGMLADNAGTHMHVGKNHVYQQDKYLYQDYRILQTTIQKILHPWAADRQRHKEQ